MNRPLSPEMVRHLKGVSDPSISPDGARVAFVYSWVDSESLDGHSQIHMANLQELDATQAAAFTQGPRDGSPRFSPDGLSLAFLRPDSNSIRQIWLIPVNGGEARQLTHSTGNIIDMAWAPYSSQLVYSADTDPEGAGSGSPADGIPRVSVARRIKYRYDGLGWRGDAHFHLYVVDAGTGSSRQVTDGDWDDVLPAWSPDGRRIAFVSQRSEDRDISSKSQAYVIPADGNGIPNPEMWSGGLDTVGALAWDPDGQRLLAAGSPSANGLGLWQSWLYVLEPGKEPQLLTDDSVRPCLGIPAISPSPELRWYREGRIVFLGETRGESFVMETNLAGETRKVAGGGMQSPMLSLDSSGIQGALATNSPDSPADIELVDLDAGKLRRLTNFNVCYLEKHKPARLEKFSINREGMEVECRLYFPPDFDPSLRYPLALEIHGGPNGSFYDSFVPLQQMLATNGYLVLAVNPRGSSTYGEEFMTAVLDDWGGEDYLDLMAAVDAVAARPYVDETRLGVHGYSYGGFMSSWMVGHTTRFKAAVVGAPCTDLLGMYGTSDIGVSFGEVQWGGALPEAFQKLVDRSPITYAARVDTPVLLLHGESDARCPIAQSEAYFVQLKRLGRVVEMVRFPGCSHSFPRQGHPRLREEYLARTLEWFNRYV